MLIKAICSLFYDNIARCLKVLMNSVHMSHQTSLENKIGKFVTAVMELQYIKHNLKKDL